MTIEYADGQAVATGCSNRSVISRGAVAVARPSGVVRTSL